MTYNTSFQINMGQSTGHHGAYNFLALVCEGGMPPNLAQAKYLRKVANDQKMDGLKGKATWLTEAGLGTNRDTCPHGLYTHQYSTSTFTISKDRGAAPALLVVEGATDKALQCGWLLMPRAEAPLIRITGNMPEGIPVPAPFVQGNFDVVDAAFAKDYLGVNNYPHGIKGWHTATALEAITNGLAALDNRIEVLQAGIIRTKPKLSTVEAPGGAITLTQGGRRRVIL